ncbi:sodium-dependent multivitamin transporter-like [Gigantopelta aegis]|uniref:sodium-dependent multivitamin transporter-like n=1 Tax=Gigantopelta aegis TaxID=1735272 RepID=UPI001B887BEE|nr:sodium-dependent multivitamin transporter-like [Gigantopelta aegis]
MVAGDYSINTGVVKRFGAVDYVLFTLTLLISCGIGVFFAIKDRNVVTTKNYLLAGRKMDIVPVSMSLVVTFMSALTLLGTPVEMYNYNTMFWWLSLSFVFALSAVIRIFIPFLFQLRITSTFEYLELRFSKKVRVLGCLILIVQTLIYLAFVLYTPSLALYAVTGFSLWGSVAAIGLVVTFYTALGGMKAVLWTDTFQAGVIAAGLLAVLIQGSIVVGGFGRAWEIADERQRILFDDFSFDPATRHSFWSIVVGAGFFWMSLYGIHQAQVQRCISLPTLRKAQWALAINIPGLIFITTMCCMIGVVMFAFYADCHPISFNRLVNKPDEILPLYVMDILGHLPGLPGIFISCLFSGSLSSLSSGLNAMGAVVVTDLIRPYCCTKMSDRTATIVTKLVVLTFGLVSMCLAYVCSLLGGVLQAAYSVFSIINGPLFGLFLFGMFFPWGNQWGAFVGCLTSLAFTLWIGIGAFVNKVRTPRSPTWTDGCNWNITTTTLTTTLSTTIATTASTAATTASTTKSILPIYTMSYFYYTPVAMVTVVVVGLIVSFLTGYTRPSSLDARLICPLFDRLFPCLPEVILKPLRFGIDHKGKYDRPIPEHWDHVFKRAPISDKPSLFTDIEKCSTDKNNHFNNDNSYINKEAANSNKETQGMDNPGFHLSQQNEDTKM